MSYIRCMSNDIYDKCLRVIDSCDKVDQLDVARNYIDFIMRGIETLKSIVNYFIITL